MRADALLVRPIDQIIKVNVDMFLFQGSAMAVRSWFYTQVSTTSSYWHGLSSISSSLSTLSYRGQAAETAGTQVCDAARSPPKSEHTHHKKKNTQGLYGFFIRIGP